MKRAMGDCSGEKLVAGWLAPVGLAGSVLSFSLFIYLSLSLGCTWRSEGSSITRHWWQQLTEGKRRGKRSGGYGSKGGGEEEKGVAEERLY